MVEKFVKVLHLLPHAGGGVGTVLRAIIQNSINDGNFEHSLVSLESLNPQMRDWCHGNKLTSHENCWEKKGLMEKALTDCDVVHIHWWNHPLLNRLLSLNTLPEIRSIVWSHVNGMNAPQVFFQQLLAFPDFFVLATPFSMESILVTEYSRLHPDRIKIIHSNAGVPAEAPEDISKEYGFRVGYIGSVDYSKMHRDFIAIWAEAQIHGEPVVVCGGPSEDAFRQEISDLGVEHLFDVRGTVSNISEVLRGLHVLMYPLNSHHYGTGEQVLLEAMSFGVVPVVMDNSCEKYLVKDGETGIVARDKEDFIRALHFLKNNPDVRDKMADRGRRNVVTSFAIKETVRQWHDLYRDLVKYQKRKHRINLHRKGDLKYDSAANLMVNTYGNTADAEIILQLIQGKEVDPEALKSLPRAFYSETRGSPFHYRHFFPGEVELDYVCNKLQEVTH